MENDLSIKASLAWILGAFIASNLYITYRYRKSKSLEEARYKRAKEKLELLKKESNEQ